MFYDIALSEKLLVSKLSTSQGRRYLAGVSVVASDVRELCYPERIAHSCNCARYEQNDQRQPDAIQRDLAHNVQLKCLILMRDSHVDVTLHARRSLQNLEPRQSSKASLNPHSEFAAIDDSTTATKAFPFKSDEMSSKLRILVPVKRVIDYAVGHVHGRLSAWRR